MNIQQIDRWNLLAYDNFVHYEDMKRISEHPKMKELAKGKDSVIFSKEGLEALHGQKLHGAVDVEAMKRMHEILPKLKYNPSDDFLWAMRDDISTELQQIKEEKGSYTLDDIYSIRLNAYAKQYNALKEAYAEGTREIYVNDGVDENDNFKFHKVTQEEDFAYLDKAFERIKENMLFSLTSKEIILEIKEKFGGEKIEIDLPKNYKEKIQSILDETVTTYKELKNQEEDVDITQLFHQFFGKDKAFADIMRKLYAITQNQEKEVCFK